MPASSLIHCSASRQIHHKNYFERHHMPRSSLESLLTEYTPSHIHSRLCRGRENNHDHHYFPPGTWMPAGSLIHCPASRQRHHKDYFERHHMPRSSSES